MLALRSPLEFPVGTATSPSGVQVARSVENSTMLRTSLKRGLLGKVRVSSPPSITGEGAREASARRGFSPRAYSTILRNPSRSKSSSSLDPGGDPGPKVSSRKSAYEISAAPVPGEGGSPVQLEEKLPKRELLGVNHPQTSMCFLGDNKSKAKWHRLLSYSDSTLN